MVDMPETSRIVDQIVPVFFPTHFCRLLALPSNEKTQTPSSTNKNPLIVFTRVDPDACDVDADDLDPSS